MQRALDRPFRSVSASHNIFWKLRNEFRGQVALWLRRESPLLAHLCVSPHRSTEPPSVRVRIAKSTVTCRMLIAFAVPGGFWPSRPWKMTCWSKIWSAIFPPCGVQCKWNQCRDLPTTSLVPDLSCFRPSLRNIHTGLRQDHAQSKSYHGRKISFQQAHVFGLFRCDIFFCKHVRRVDADVVHLNKCSRCMNAR